MTLHFIGIRGEGLVFKGRHGQHTGYDWQQRNLLGTKKGKYDLTSLIKD